MIFAVTYNKDNTIHNQFETSEFFKLYETENGQIINVEAVSTLGKRDNELLDILSLLEADAVICNNISNSLAQLLNGEGILVYSKCYGNVDAAVKKFLKGEFSLDIKIT